MSSATNHPMTEKLPEGSPKQWTGQHSGRSWHSNNEKWCEDCQASYSADCTRHKLLFIPDKKFLPRAFATLPRHLVISEVDSDGHSKRKNYARKGASRTPQSSKETGEEAEDGNVLHFVRDVVGRDDGDDDDNEDEKAVGHEEQNETNPVVRGVFARRAIPKRVQFGPLVCKLVEEGRESKKQAFRLLLDDVDGKTYLADITDAEACNWMMFVRPASSSSDQNLVAFQHDRSLFYLTTKNIKVGQELRVWYAKPYAERSGASLLEDQKLGNIDVYDNKEGQSNDYLCDSLPLCKGSETIQSEDLPRENSARLDLDSRACEVGLKTGSRRLIERRKDIGKEKKCDENNDFVEPELAGNKESSDAGAADDDGDGNDDDDDDDDDGDDGEYLPKRQKKKSWSFRKHKKKKSKSSLPSKCRSDNGEWSCRKCDLAFRDPSVLSLHALVHAAENAGSDPDGNMSISLAKMFESSEDNSPGGENHVESLMMLTCPVCNKDFETKTALISHVGQHASPRQPLACSKPFKCQLCLKTFSLFERLQQHLLCHGDESLKPLACEVCSRRFMNPAALAVHMKTHSDRKYYACPLCPESFDQIQLLRAHAEERHLERTIKAFDPMLEVGSGRLEVRGSSGGSADSLNRVDAGRSTESSSAFTGDSSCAAVAIATATTAIASGVWIGAVYPNGSGSEVAMTMEGELEFIGDVGHCLFAEEVTTNDAMSATNAAADAAIDNDLTQLLELNAEVENSGFSTANKDPSKKIEGTYHCPECHRVFAEFSAVSRHVRLFHSSRSFECKDCGRTFPRRDKLRLHALRHSSHREFVCETCGRQFKRKDKLRDHLRRQHDPSKERDLLASMVTAKQRNADAPAFTPAISPLDFMKFVFKCQKCLLGFKRRGMLVNHLAKKHPDIPMESVPELNLPIITSRHDFFCQYCSKVFKSSSKRKFHILKHHPGSELPASLRPNKKQSPEALVTDKSVEAPVVFQSNASYSTPNGHLASEPFSCNMCHKQYTSKSKLLQHRRKKHAASDYKNIATFESTGVPTEPDDVADTLRAPATSVEDPRPSSLEVDYSELFVTAPIFFTSKSSNSLEISGENELATAGNVMVLSNEEELLAQSPTQLSFSKTPSFASHQAEVSYNKSQQTVIINTDIFNQAISELSKTYANKNSVILTRYDAQQQCHFSQNGGHSNMISLAIDNGSRFVNQPQEGARLIQVNPSAGATAIVTSPFVGVIEYEQLCSIGPDLSRTSL